MPNKIFFVLQQLPSEPQVQIIPISTHSLVVVVESTGEVDQPLEPHKETSMTNLTLQESTTTSFTTSDTIISYYTLGSEELGEPFDESPPHSPPRGDNVEDEDMVERGAEEVFFRMTPLKVRTTTMLSKPALKLIINHLAQGFPLSRKLILLLTPKHFPPFRSKSYKP